MANLGVSSDFWRKRRVFVTGDTGFKGAWLSLWLKHLGAQFVGFALGPPTVPSLYERAAIGSLIEHIHGDVRDRSAVATAMAAAEPDVVFHLAAQPLVRESYLAPVETYATNVMGTVHVLEAARAARNKGRSGPQAVVIITSDKCYEEKNLSGDYVETDAMGGHDPYSSSKGCAELVAAAYRRSFADAGIGIATARAGNVFGGGDWAKDRLIPDAIRAFVANEPLVLRHPKAVRPFQHVLEPLTGYLLLAESLYKNGEDFAEAWNFGPDPGGETAEHVVAVLADCLGTSCIWSIDEGASPRESERLKLDSSKARARLSWRPQLALQHALKLTADWHRWEAAHPCQSMLDFTLAQIRDYADS